MPKQWVLFGCVSGFFAVVFGAFGGHVLKEKLSEKALSIYLVGIQYQTMHALALIALGLWGAQNLGVDTTQAGWAFTAGIILFSGSLYCLALTDLRFLGMITPIGGVAFLAGWALFALAVMKS